MEMSRNRIARFSTRSPFRSGEPRICGAVTNHRTRFDAWKRAAAASRWCT